MKTNRDNRDKVKALRQQGGRAAEIARVLGISRQRVSQILKKEGLVSDTRPAPVSRRHVKLTPDQWAKRKAESRERERRRQAKKRERAALVRGFSMVCALAEGCAVSTGRGRASGRGASQAYREGMELARVYLKR